MSAFLKEDWALSDSAWSWPGKKRAPAATAAAAHPMSLSGVKPAGLGGLESEGLTRPGSTDLAVDNLVEEPQEIGQVKPEPAIQAAGAETAIEQRVMPLHHHEPFAFEAIHSSISSMAWLPASTGSLAGTHRRQS
jgi:hypothetical protein